MGRDPHQKYSVSERARRLRSTGGTKTWKHGRAGHSPQRRKAPDDIASARGRHSRINDRWHEASRVSLRNDEMFCDEDGIVELSGTSEEEDFYWDEEQSLFSDLMEGVDSKVSEVDWTELYEALQEAIDDNSVALKKEMASVFVPTVNRLKNCFRFCDQKDREFGEGVLKLNSTFKEHEILVIKTEDDLKEAFNTAQNEIDKTVKQLEEAYVQRDKLWTKLHEKIAQIADPVAELLQAAPTDIELVIAAQEKKSRAQEKEEGNSTILTEEALKELLKKL